MRRLVVSLIVVASLFAGEQNGALTGRVSDEEGFPIVRAKIRVSGTGQTTWQLDPFGNFSIPNIPPGRHTIIVSAPGYEDEAFEILMFRAGRTRRIEAVLCEGTPKSEQWIQDQVLQVGTLRCKVMRSDSLEDYFDIDPREEIRVDTGNEWFDRYRDERGYWTFRLPLGRHKLYVSSDSCDDSGPLKVIIAPDRVDTLHVLLDCFYKAPEPSILD